MATMQGDVATLELLDVRTGYAPAEVASTMAAWGPRGRTLYLLVEAIDVTLYCTAYRSLLLVLSNRQVPLQGRGREQGCAIGFPEASLTALECRAN